MSNVLEFKPRLSRTQLKEAVRQHLDKELAGIATSPEEFIQAAEKAVAELLKNLNVPPTVHCTVTGNPEDHTLIVEFVSPPLDFDPEFIERLRRAERMYMKPAND